MGRPAAWGIVVGFAMGLLAPTVFGAEEPLKVFAASSLTEAVQEIARDFEKANPGATVALNFAGSQVLRTQIEQGALADVFAPADLVHAETLKRSRLLAGYEVFARNALVVVVPGSAARVHGLQDVARPGMKVVVAGPSVPVGRYTTEVLAKLAASGLYGDDFQARVQANVVSQETNVRAVLAKVSLGEADAGFVYSTDAKTAGAKVGVLAIADRYNVVAEYPIGIPVRSTHPRAAAFIARVLGSDGQAVLRKYGFR
jgi:molybdate transport system substrate-binding protein